MSFPGPSPWTTSVVDRFHKLLAVTPLLRYSEIAITLSVEFNATFTKNSCIGYGRRHGVTPRSPPRIRPHGVSHKHRDRPHTPKLHLPPMLIQPPTPKRKNGSMVKIEHLRERDCRWPHGDDPPFLYCGKPKLEGCSYCIEHARKAYPALARTL